MATPRMYDRDTLIQQEQRTLTLGKFAAMTEIGMTTRESMRLEAMEDVVTQKLVMRLEADVLRDKIVEDHYDKTYYYKVYASPWQHFKDLHAPAWFKHHYPVRYTKKSGTVRVDFTRWAQYPKANVSLRKDERFFEVTLGGFESIWDEVE